MSNNFFEEEESDYMTEEQAAELERSVAKVPVQKLAPHMPSLQEIPEEVQEWADEQGFEVFSDEDLENDEELMTDVSLRLEQGRLYQMILNHNLFEDVEAPAKAIANVQREIRQHIKSRLAILLGLKPDSQVPQKQQAQQFTPMEVDMLKGLLSKLSKGATEQYKEPPAEVAPKENKISVVSEKKKQTITAISSPKSVQKIQVSKPEPKQAATKSQPQSKVYSQPNKIKTRIEQIKELESYLDKTAKPRADMNPTELSERNALVEKLENLKKPPKPAHALPMPALDQINMAYQAQAVNTTNTFLNGAMGKALNGRK